jgi:serine/threonine protein kinase
MIGTHFGQYQITALLGAGGMGEVFRARDTRLNREVAIKLLPKAFAADAERLRRFEQEAKSLAALNHPNVLTVYDAGLHEGTPYLVSELLEGQTLRELLAGSNKAPLPLRRATDYALQIAHGLSAAHSKGIIHRDLKPENVFITKDGRVKILDFGLAKLTPVAADVRRLTSSGVCPTVPADKVSLLTSAATEPGLVLGTPAYMSPEQVRGEPADHRSDIFAFGCVLYEMLTGAGAFRRDTPVQSMNAVLSEEPVEVSAGGDNLPPALERLLQRCLEKPPERRFQTASDLAFAIETAGAVSSASWKRLSSSSKTWQAGLRPFAAGAVASLLLATGIYFALNGKHSSPPAQQPKAAGAVRKFDLALPQPADAELSSVLSPDGRKLAYINGEGLWLRALDKIMPPVLLASGANLVSPFWSPLSTDLGYFVGATLYRVPAAGGAPLLVGVAPEEMSTAGGGAWLGHEIYFTTGGSGLLEVPAQGGKVTVALPPDEGERDFHQAAALPEGRGIVFVVHKSAGAMDTIAAWKPGQHRKVLLDLSGSTLRHPVAAAPGHIVFVRGDETSGLWAFPFSAERLVRTGELVRISDAGSEPSAANDGTLAYNLREWKLFAHRQLVWVDRSGKLLHTVGSAMPGLVEPLISPDGHRAVAAAGPSYSESALWMFDLAGGEPIRFSRAHNGERLGGWWPDGQSVVCVRGIAAGEDQTLRISADGGTSEQTLFDGPGVISPSGKFLFVSQRTAKGKMTRGYISLADPQRKVIPLLEMLQRSQPYQVEPSPDDRHLAFISMESGRFEIYLTDFPGFTNTVVVSRGGGQHPEWHPNGMELFYLGGNAGRTLISRKLKPDGRLEEPVAVFTLPSSIQTGQGWWPSVYAVAPDGDRFLMLSKPQEEHAAANPAKPNVRIVMNWFEEFRNSP